MRLRDHKADLIAALGNIEHRGHRAHRVDEADHRRTYFEERAAIREYDGGLSRQEAEARTFQDTIAHRKTGEGFELERCLRLDGSGFP